MRWGYSTANTWRRPSQSIPSAITIARFKMTPPSRSTRRLNGSNCSSGRCVMPLMRDARNSCPHDSPVMAVTSRVETRCTCTCAYAATNALPLRGSRSNTGVLKRPDPYPSSGPEGVVPLLTVAMVAGRIFFMLFCRKSRANPAGSVLSREPAQN
jgi:hypothetical protein